MHESPLAAQFSPNPSAGLVTITGPVALAGTPGVVYDALGKAMLTTGLAGGRLSLSALTPGTYSLAPNTNNYLLYKCISQNQE